MTVISVVSGKGGAGKSLLTAVLGRALAREGKKVLLVDLDIFVRGLTVLLYGYKRPERNSERATTSDLLGVYASESAIHGPTSADFPDSFLIERFLECDVLPAVANIAAPLDYDDRSLSDLNFCYEAVSKIITVLRPEYDYILIDNRAGMDSLVLATCMSADAILSIAEDDEVGRQTNVNLVRFVQNRTKSKVVYTIVNKGRGIESYPDVESRSRQRSEYSILGVVPFDIEVMKTFGSDRFWTDVTSTLYFRAIIDAWNELRKSEPIDELKVSRYNFPPSILMRKDQGRFSLFERVLRVYGILFIFAAMGLWLYSQYRLRDIDWITLAPFLTLFLGTVSLLLSTSKFQNVLYGVSRSAKQTGDE